MDTDAHRADLQHMLRMVDHEFEQTAVETGLARPSTRVRDALATLPRHCFVPPDVRFEAYDNRPLPIGQGQTISQPFIVALMTDLLALGDGDSVLEIGTGCGYQTALLAQLARRVVSVEIVPELAAQARARLSELNLRNVELHVADGHDGWPAAAPFDRIIVTAAPPEVPAALVDQLRLGGRMVLPMGPHLEAQDLCVLDKRPDATIALRRTIGVRFVPMTHTADPR